MSISPKDKALSLCQQFGILATNWDCNNYVSLPLQSAKECATVLVKEMLLNGNLMDENMALVSNCNPEQMETYWLSVLAELNDL